MSICLAFGLAQALLFWLTTDASVPIQRALTDLNLVPVVLSFMVSGNVHRPSAVAFYSFVVVQWALVLWIVLRIVSLLRERAER